MKKIMLIFFFLLVIFCQWIVAQDKPLNIVATQRIFADLVKEVGGDKVDVSSIASAKYNIHFIQPRPSDVRRVAKADLYVNAGLDLEAWSDPLLEAAGNPTLFRHAKGNLDLSQGIRLLRVPEHDVTRAQGDIHLFGNPHFQMNPENARPMIHNILNKLKEIDPVNSVYFEERAKAFLVKLDQKIMEWKNQCAHCQSKEIISYHDDIAYFSDFLGLKVEQFLESKPGIPPTPKHLQFIEEYVLAHKIEAIVLPTYYSRSEAERLAQRIGVQIVTICQGLGELPGTDSFFDFFDYNFKQISGVFKI